jgi:two-component system sensor histidine kinase KdpD
VQALDPYHAAMSIPLVHTSGWARAGLVCAAALVCASVAVAALETFAGVPNASIVYLAAVVVTAIVGGTPGAIVASVGSFLVYDFLFTQPVFTFAINDPGEWLSVVLLLFVGIVVGQLAALERSRTADARAREREAWALFQVSRTLATRESTASVLPNVAEIVRAQMHIARVWISLGADGRERIAADTDGSSLPLPPPVHYTLRRMPGEEPSTWVRVHDPSTPRVSRDAPRLEAFRVRIEASGSAVGSLWALRERSWQLPDRTETRLLAAAADQLGQAAAHDRLAADLQAAEIARQSDELRAALLQSVSHDLRTPLATIRTAAGTLRPARNLSADEQEASADAIDREVEYLNRLVTNLLDLSRIEAGAMRPDVDVFDLDDLVGQTVDRMRGRLDTRSVEVQLEGPPVEVDPIFLDEAVTNALDNAIKHTPAGTAIRIRSAALATEPFVRLTIEDAGPGVPAESMPNLFEKFYRVPGMAPSSRAGTGIGLAVVRGLIEATRGRVGARSSELGGLAIDLDLPVATLPVDLAASS